MAIESTLDKEDNLNNQQKPAEPNADHSTKKGLDEWNQRLDNNLEAEHSGDPQADDNAKTYSEQFGSSGQSETLATPSSTNGPRDGHDNTGTQGYDSLSDDAYTGSSGKDSNTEHESRTGSSSEDFNDKEGQ